MTQKWISIVIILLQIAATIWYVWPYQSNIHVPAGFIKMIIYVSVAVVLLAIAIFSFFYFKPHDFTAKIPFILFVIMLLLGWFYNS